MPRRPPQHPLPRGLVWRLAASGKMRAGDPLAEWAYVTPQEPDGIQTTALRYATAQQQIDTAGFWFLSNYEPFINDGRWFGFDMQGSGFGQAPFAPAYYPPGTLLQEEFAETVPDDALTILATELEGQAGLWMLIPDLPQIMLTVAGNAPTDPLITAEAALANVGRALQAVETAPASTGHNQGPPFFNAHLREEIVQAVRLAQEGVAAKGAGVPTAEEGQSLSHPLIPARQTSR